MFIQDLFISYYDYRPFKNSLLNKVCGNATKIGACVGQYILPLWFKAFPCWKISNSQKENVVVCLTSFPRRIGVVWLVIECLMRQSIHASCIVLYLSKKQFTENTLPKRLQEYQRRGILKIRLVDEDIRSHKKYWYAISEYPGMSIITVDDDIIYSSDTIKDLVEGSKKNPGSVISRYSSKICYDLNGDVLPYSEWKGYLHVGDKGKNIFFGSGGGTLFPAGCLNEANQPYEIIKTVCPLADDIWLNAYIRYNGFDVVCVHRNAGVPEWHIEHNQKLCYVNGELKCNDVQLFDVIRYFEEKYSSNPFSL